MSLAPRWLLFATVAWCLLHGAASVSTTELPLRVDPGIRQAMERGSARVLVELRVQPLPVSEGTPPSSDAASSRQSAISAAQRDVLSRLAPYHVSLTRQFEPVPFLAIEIEGRRPEGTREHDGARRAGRPRSAAGAGRAAMKRRTG